MIPPSSYFLRFRMVLDDTGPHRDPPPCGGTRHGCPCAAALARGFCGMPPPIGPLCSGFRPSARASLFARRCLRPAVAPGLRLPPAASPLRRGGPRPGLLPRPVGACVGPPLRRRPWPPAASLRLRLRPPAARCPGPRAGRCGRPWAAAGGPAARPPRRCGLPAFPRAAPGGGSPRCGPVRRLPSLVPRSVGGIGPASASVAPAPGPPAALRAAFSGSPAPGFGGWGFRRCGGGDAICGPGAAPRHKMLRHLLPLPPGPLPPAGGRGDGGPPAA